MATRTRSSSIPAGCTRRSPSAASRLLAGASFPNLEQHFLYLGLLAEARALLPAPCGTTGRRRDASLHRKLSTSWILCSDQTGSARRGKPSSTRALNRWPDGAYDIGDRRKQRSTSVDVGRYHAVVTSNASIASFVSSVRNTSSKLSPGAAATANGRARSAWTAVGLRVSVLGSARMDRALGVAPGLARVLQK